MARKYRTLSEYLRQTGTTNEAFAGKLGVTPPYVSMIASGKRTPKLPLALRISKLTGVPLHSLIRDERKAVA